MTAFTSLGLRSVLTIGALAAALATSACTTHYEMDAAYPGEDDDSSDAPIRRARDCSRHHQRPHSRKRRARSR